MWLFFFILLGACAASEPTICEVCSEYCWEEQGGTARRQLQVEPMRELMASMVVRMDNLTLTLLGGNRRRQLQVDPIQDLLDLMASMVLQMENMTQAVQNSTVTTVNAVVDSVTELGEEIAEEFGEQQDYISDSVEGFKAGAYNYMNSFVIGISAALGAIVVFVVLYKSIQCWRSRKAAASAKVVGIKTSG